MVVVGPIHARDDKQHACGQRGLRVSAVASVVRHLSIEYAACVPWDVRQEAREGTLCIDKLRVQAGAPQLYPTASVDDKSVWDSMQTASPSCQLHVASAVQY